MRSLRAILLVVAVVASVLPAAPSASAAALPDFPLALPVAWGAAVQAGGPHTHYNGVRSSVDLGAASGTSIPVVAAAAGVVTVKGAGAFSRCMVVIQHSDGWQTQYYHLRAIPAGLRTGQRVAAGQQIGMTGMPGTETCGRGTFRHVHFSLYRDGAEQPIHGMVIGGYRIHATSGAYCGYWSRLSDGVVVADARRACVAVPQVANTLVHPDTLDTAMVAAPVIAAQDTIDSVSLYITPGQHTVNGRAWLTQCESYSTSVERCTTHIWATTIQMVGGSYFKVNDWAWNNLTYKPAPRSHWAGNPLGNHNSPDGWVASDGRRWRTECDTAATGRNGCRSWIWASTIQEVRDSSGRVRFVNLHGWVFNNIVHFQTERPAITALSLTTAADGGTELTSGGANKSPASQGDENDAIVQPSTAPTPVDDGSLGSADAGDATPVTDASPTSSPVPEKSLEPSSPVPEKPLEPGDLVEAQPTEGSGED